MDYNLTACGRSTIAVWRVPRMAPLDRQTFTVTFAGPINGGNAPRGTIRWARPAVKADDVVDIVPARGRGRG